MFKKIDAGGEVLRAALDESDERVRRDMIATIGIIGSRFDELTFLVRDVEQTAAAIQSSLDIQSADVRAIMGQNDRQSTDIRLIRENLAVMMRRTDGEAGKRDAITGPRWRHGCPYRGLLPFEETDADVFYGRERLTAGLAVQIAARVGTGGPIVVTGASGAGKSSLLRAGLLPALAAGQQIAGSEYWPRIIMPVSQDPLGDLAAHLAALGGGDPLSIRTGLEQDPGAAHLMAWSAVLGDTARRPPSERPGSTARLVLIVDQFEQVFTLRPGAAGEPGRRAFVAALCAAATKPVGPQQEPAAIVVIAVRGDFWDRCAAYPELVDALRDGQFVVGPMTESELRLTITGPADAAGLDIDPTLPDTILSDLRAIGGEGTVGVLPLLSQAMALTWDSRQDNRLTIHGYGQAGGVTRAVEVSADSVYDALPAADQGLARELLRSMTVASRDDRLTRRPVTRADLYHAHPDAASSQVDTVLEAFAAERLVVLNDNTAQISHDALLSAWPRLRGWLEEDRASWILYGQLSEDAAAWHDGRRDPSFLYRGTHLAALREASAQWAAHPARFPALTSVEEAFLRASQRAATRSARQRRAAVGALALLTALTMTASVLFLNQRSTAISQRNAAQLSAIAANGLQLAGTNLSLAAQLDLTAYQEKPGSSVLDARLLGTENMALSTPLAAETGQVLSVAVSQNGGTLASGGTGGAIRLWNVANPADPRPVGPPLTGAGSVNKLAISPDGRTLAVASSIGAVLWNISDPAHPGSLGLLPGSGGNAYLAVAFSPDGRTRAVGGASGLIQLWDVTSPGRPVPDGSPVRGSTAGPVDSLAFSPYGRMLADGGGDGKLRLWDISTPGRPAMIGRGATINPDSVIASVAFSPDGRTLAASDLNGNALLWSISSSPQRGTYIGSVPTGSPVYSLAFSPNSQELATGGADGTIRVWNVTVPTSPQVLLSPLTGHASFAYAVAFGSDGDTLFSGGADGLVRVWSLPRTALTGHPGLVDSVAFSPDDRVLASAGAGGVIRLWDVANPAAPEPVGAPLAGSKTGSVNTVSFRPDGRLLASGGYDNSVRLWDVTNPRAPEPVGEPLAVGTGSGASAGADSVAFSPNGRILATGAADHRFQLWDVSDPAAPVRLGQPVAATAPILAVVFSPDGKMLAVAFGNDVQLWNVADPAVPAKVGQPISGPVSVVGSVAFSPNGRTLAVGSYDGTIRLWNVTAPAYPQLIGGQSLDERDGFVNSLAYSPNGRFLASGNGNGTFQLWTVASSGAVQAFGAPVIAASGWVYALAFSHNSEMLAIGSTDYSVRLWNLSMKSAADRICALSKNNLAREQWTEYVQGQPYDPPCRQ